MCNPRQTSIITFLQCQHTPPIKTVALLPPTPTKPWKGPYPPIFLTSPTPSNASSSVYPIVSLTFPSLTSDQAHLNPRKKPTSIQHKITKHFVRLPWRSTMTLHCKLVKSSTPQTVNL
jgi:hypothetical protein